ncbi:hypothetical protein PTSG_09137 [Salpingoeca rosetta]|uniref:Fungal lipase-type domain-containing protein n=1 Tax=Salpingoeca rosetta (strain ATCC 50818 / BSB-021) TaxID=946362 RepID=F2UMU3_SALR5|nr:uncharacterized protein PTSG_09137 [Salpingoeca rosetta]EGD78442.1 hypothetical protein PTSG_09137 [Salpingoeca rosetta]|eukprot:XP_004989391.1 hypothetical protein PTSG_09137 [Salpingoeca rosetta]
MGPLLSQPLSERQKAVKRIGLHLSQPKPLDQCDVDVDSALAMSICAYSDNPLHTLRQLNGLPHKVRHVKRGQTSESLNQQWIIGANADESVFYIGFKGTTDATDWWKNARLTQTHKSLGKVHSGFLSCAEEFPREIVQQVLNENKKVVVTGHSKGGAVAQTLCILLLEDLVHVSRDKLVSNLRCVTFASPLVGDEQIAKCIKARWGDIFFHIVNDGDIVPLVMTLYQQRIADGLSSAAHKFAELLKELAKGTSVLQVVATLADHGPLPAKLAAAALRVTSSVLQAGAREIGHRVFRVKYYPFGSVYKLRARTVVCILPTPVSFREEDDVDGTPHFYDEEMIPPELNRTDSGGFPSHSQLLAAHSLGTYAVRLKLQPTVSCQPQHAPDFPFQGAFLCPRDIRVHLAVHSTTRLVVELQGKKLFMAREMRPTRTTDGTSKPAQAQVAFLSGISSARFEFPSVVLEPAMEEYAFSLMTVLDEECIVTIRRQDIRDHRLSEGNKCLHPMFDRLTSSEVVHAALVRALLILSCHHRKNAAHLDAQHTHAVKHTVSTLDCIFETAQLAPFLDLPEVSRPFLENGVRRCRSAKECTERRNEVAVAFVDLLETAMTCAETRRTLNKTSFTPWEKTVLTRLYKFAEKEDASLNVIERGPRGKSSSVRVGAPTVNLFPDGSEFMPSEMADSLRQRGPAAVASILLRAQTALAIVSASLERRSLDVWSTNLKIHKQDDLQRTTAQVQDAFSELYASTTLNWWNKVHASLFFVSRDVWRWFMTQFTVSSLREVAHLMAGLKDTQGQPISDEGLCVDLLGLEHLLTLRVETAAAISGLQKRELLSKSFAQLPSALKKGDHRILKSNLQKNTAIESWDLIRAHCMIHELRLGLSGRLHIGAAGAMNLGKSYMLKQIFSANTNPGPHDHHRNSSLSTHVEGDIVLLDFPGIDDTGSVVSHVFQDGIAAVDLLILIVEGTKVRANATVDVLRAALLQSSVPVLICLHRADQWRGEHSSQADFIASLQDSKDKVQDLLARANIPFDTERVTLVPTCFTVQQPQEELARDLRAADVWDLVDVRNWIAQHSTTPIPNQNFFSFRLLLTS